MKENVFSGSGDLIELVLSDQNDVPIPFVTNGVDRMDLFFDNKTISSTDDPSLIAWDDAGGITLNLGTVDAQKFRSLEAILKAYSPTFPHPKGQSLINPNRENSNLQLVFS